MTNVDSPSPIVVGVDGSMAAIRAAEWAIDEATSRGLTLRLVHVAAFDELLLTGTEQTVLESPLRGAASAVAATGKPVKVDTAVIRGAVLLTLADESRRAAMMCVGSVGIGRVARTLLGSTAAALVTKAHCPVAIIRSESDAPPEGGGWIAVAVDDKSDAVLYYAMEEGRLRKAPVLAVAARWHSPAGTAAQTLKQRIDSWIRRYPDVVVRLVDAYAGALQYVEHHDLNVQLAVVSPADADFVMRLVGPHGHPILAHADCSVLVVRP